MRHFYGGIISTIIVFSLISCNTSKKEFSPPIFEKWVKLKHTVIQDTLLLHRPEGIISFGKYIVLNTLTDEKNLHAYDKQTGEYLGGYVRQGQGPGEIATHCMCLDYYKKEKIITLLEENTNHCFIYAVNNDPENLLTFKSKNSFLSNRTVGFERLQDLYKIDENLYLSDSRIYPLTNNNQRFSLITETGEKTSEYNDFATDDLWAYSGYQRNISISPNRKKVVCATLNGAVLETFKVGDSITLINKKLFYPIILGYTKGGNVIPVDETILGFFDICTSDEYVFSIFIGTKERMTGFNNISVFNWNGDPVIRFETDIDLYYICYNEDDNFIYAVARKEDSEFILVKFDISEYL